MEELVVSIPVLAFGDTLRTFVVLGRPAGSLALGRFINVLRFTVKEIDPSTGGHALPSHPLLPVSTACSFHWYWRDALVGVGEEGWGCFQ